MDDHFQVAPRAKTDPFGTEFITQFIGIVDFPRRMQQELALSVLKGLKLHAIGYRVKGCGSKR